jgi:hypothetical protein
MTNEISRIREAGDCPARRRVAPSDETHVDNLGIPRTTFYRWYDRYLSGGAEALEDRNPRPSWVWNRIPEAVREKVKDLALKESDLAPHELAVQFADTEKYPRPLSSDQWRTKVSMSESSEYRILKSYDLITSPA